MKLLLSVLLVLELISFVAHAIYLFEGGYPRHTQTTRTQDIVSAFIAAAMAYWILVLLN